jgi:ABC-type transport system substrate-binding protein
MSRKLWYVLAAVLVTVAILSSCGGGATPEPEEPTSTPEIVNPPVIKEEQPTATPEPEEPEEPEETEEPEEPEDVPMGTEFQINGVTMDFGREEVIINNQVDYSIFDSFNPMIPNGWHYQAGTQQVVVEFMWYVNYATGELLSRLGESWEYNDDYTELKIYLRKGVTWNDGEAFTADDVVFTFNQWMNKDDLPLLDMVTYVDPCPLAAWFNELNEHLEAPEFRRAMSMLMNRQKWGDNIWSPPSKPAQGLWADYRNLDKYINEEAKETWGTLEYNPDKALELLESIGYTQEGGQLLDPDGEQVQLAVTTPVGVGGNEYLMGQDFTEELKSFGIDATFEYVEGVFWDNVDNGEFDIGFWWFCGATVDPVELYDEFICENAAPQGEVSQKGNGMRHCNEEFDATLLALQALDPDHPDAPALYDRMFDLWLEDPPGVPLIETYYSISYNQEFWDNTLASDNVYTVPFNWWGQIIEIFFNAKMK